MRTRLSRYIAALVLALFAAAPVSAGDGSPAVIVHPNGACTACEVRPSVAYTRMRPPAEHPLIAHRKALPPKTINLCPGACFGYFPTQWRSWDEACGMPAIAALPIIPPSSDMTPMKNGDMGGSRIK